MFFFLGHAFPEILETLLQWNLYSGYSLQANSALGGNREKLTHERHVRGDTIAGGVREKGELATITSKFSFPSRKKPRDITKRENCHRKRAADWKSNNYLSSLDRRGCMEIIYLLTRFRNSFPLHQRRMFLTTDMFYFLSTGHGTSTCPLK